MSSELESWPRACYEGPGGRPFLFFAVHGAFSTEFQIDAAIYRTRGVYPGLTLSRYDRHQYPDVLTGFQEGYAWNEFVAEDPAAARRVAESDECVILRGELEDQPDLDYLRDAVGLLTYFVDHGGVCVHDPHQLRWWTPGAWKRTIFEPRGPVPNRHVVILTSDEDAPGSAGEPLTWFHTRGLRKFGRPDLSLHDVAPRWYEGVIDLFERFINLQAQGGTIAEGSEIRMKSLPQGLRCRHAGDLDDLDFNNVHVAIEWPR